MNRSMIANAKSSRTRNKGISTTDKTILYSMMMQLEQLIATCYKMKVSKKQVDACWDRYCLLVLQPVEEDIHILRYRYHQYVAQILHETNILSQAVKEKLSK